MLLGLSFEVLAFRRLRGLDVVGIGVLTDGTV
jgi:hypothetical protein